jgi:hypothetical protein
MVVTCTLLTSMTKQLVEISRFVKISCLTFGQHCGSHLSSFSKKTLLVLTA